MLTKEDIDNISKELMNLVFTINTGIFTPSQMSKELSIPHSHMKTIFHLVMFGPCPISKIASELIISKSNMTPIIDNLIYEGYVNRFNAPNDRRVIMIEATPKAHTFLMEGKLKFIQLLSKKISILSNDDLETLKTLIPQLTSIITKTK